MCSMYSFYYSVEIVRASGKSPSCFVCPRLAYLVEVVVLMRKLPQKDGFILCTVTMVNVDHIISSEVASDWYDQNVTRVPFGRSLHCYSCELRG